MENSKSISLRKKVAFVIGGMALSIGTFALPANADGYFSAYHGDDFIESGGTNYGINVCDNEIDGHTAFANVELVNGSTYQVYDRDNTCTNEHFGHQIKRMQACETTPGSYTCFAWVNMN